MDGRESAGRGNRYRLAHARFVRLVDGVGDDVMVPATPGWTLHALLSHLVGVAADLADGRVDRWAQPGWTAGHVAARVDRSRRELLAAWDASESSVVAIMDDPVGCGLDDMFGRLPLIDLIAHEHDVREALGAREMLADEDWAVLAPIRLFWLDACATAAGLPALRVVTDRGDDWTIGSGVPHGSVTVARQELWRSLEGRRPRQVVRTFGWSVDPEPYLDVWLGPAFSWPDDNS